MTIFDHESVIAIVGYADFNVDLVVAEGFALLVRVESGRTVRRWESGERDIPGPVIVLVTALQESQSVRRYFGVQLADVSTPKSE